MGTWGTGLYDDDDACDARDRFNELVGGGEDPADAAGRVADELGVSEDDDSVVWLVVADVLHRVGALTEVARRRALAMFETDVDRFAPADRPARTAMLGRLRARLAGDARADVVIPSEPPVHVLTDDGPRWDGDLDLTPGRVLALRRADGLALLQVVADVPGAVGGTLVFDVMDWAGEGLPGVGDLAQLIRRRRAGPRGSELVTRLRADGVDLDPSHPLHRLYLAVADHPDLLPPLRYRPYGNLPRRRLADLGMGPPVEPRDAGWPATDIEWAKTGTEPLN